MYGEGGGAVSKLSFATQFLEGIGSVWECEGVYGEGGAVSNCNG